MDDEYRKGSSGWSYMIGNEEFQETDIWSVYNHNNNNDFDSKSVKKIKPKGSTSSRTTSTTISHSNSAFMMIPRPNNTDIESWIPQRQTAPVNIPDWSKIYGGYNAYDDHNNNGKESWDSDDDDDNGEIMPPHEWIAQKMARSQISSFSVCEGAGRTLKGRDLSRVRNAVLTKTGFLE